MGNDERDIFKIESSTCYNTTTPVVKFANALLTPVYVLSIFPFRPNRTYHICHENILYYNIIILYTHKSTVFRKKI